MARARRGARARAADGRAAAAGDGRGGARRGAVAGRRARLVAAETDGALALAVRHGHAWAAGELLTWRRRAGAVERRRRSRWPSRSGGARGRAGGGVGALERARLSLRGGARVAGVQRRVDAALEPGRAAAAGGAAGRDAARAPAPRAGRARPGRGPRASTRRNPAGLTSRELEVLALLAEGLRNVHIAERLVLSARTVDHHVSAILRKLKAATRTEAAAQAVQLGILGR